MALPEHQGPIILFHNITHARAVAQAARELDVAVTAVTAPGAVRYLGASVLKAIADEASLPEAWIDCGSSSQSVQLALRAGWKRILFDPAHPAYDRLMGLAGLEGAQILPRWDFPAGPLDLLRASDPLLSCKEFLKNF